MVRHIAFRRAFSLSFSLILLVDITACSDQKKSGTNQVKRRSTSSGESGAGGTNAGFDSAAPADQALPLVGEIDKLLQVANRRKSLDTVEKTAAPANHSVDKQILDSLSVYLVGMPVAEVSFDVGFGVNAMPSLASYLVHNAAANEQTIVNYPLSTQTFRNGQLVSDHPMARFVTVSNGGSEFVLSNGDQEFVYQLLPGADRHYYMAEMRDRYNETVMTIDVNAEGKLAEVSFPLINKRMLVEFHATGHAKRASYEGSNRFSSTIGYFPSARIASILYTDSTYDDVRLRFAYEGNKVSAEEISLPEGAESGAAYSTAYSFTTRDGVDYLASVSSRNHLIADGESRISLNYSQENREIGLDSQEVFVVRGFDDIKGNQLSEMAYLHGNLIEVRDPNTNATQKYRYDELNRVVKAVQGGSTIEIAYVGNSKQLVSSQTTKRGNIETRQEYSYDNLSRPVRMRSVAVSTGSIVSDVNMSYSSTASMRPSMLDSLDLFGRRTVERFNMAGQLISREQGDSHYAFVYDDKGRFAEERLNGILTRSQSFSADNRTVTTVNHISGEARTVNYDDQMRVTSVASAEGVMNYNWDQENGNLASWSFNPRSGFNLSTSGSDAPEAMSGTCPAPMPTSTPSYNPEPTYSPTPMSTPSVTP